MSVDLQEFSPRAGTQGCSLLWHRGLRGTGTARSLLEGYERDWKFQDRGGFVILVFEGEEIDTNSNCHDQQTADPGVGKQLQQCL